MLIETDTKNISNDYLLDKVNRDENLSQTIHLGQREEIYCIQGNIKSSRIRCRFFNSRQKRRRQSKQIISLNSIFNFTSKQQEMR